jgi:hypothetical protein
VVGRGERAVGGATSSRELTVPDKRIRAALSCTARSKTSHAAALSASPISPTSGRSSRSACCTHLTALSAVVVASVVILSQTTYVPARKSGEMESEQREAPRAFESACCGALRFNRYVHHSPLHQVHLRSQTRPK